MEALRNATPGLKGRALPGPDDYEQIPALAERGRASASCTSSSRWTRVLSKANSSPARATVSPISRLWSRSISRTGSNLPVPETCEHLRRWHAQVSARPAPRREAAAAADERHSPDHRVACRRRDLGSEFRGCSGATVRAPGRKRHTAVAGRGVRHHAPSGCHGPQVFVAGRHRRDHVECACLRFLDTDDFQKSPFTTVYATRKPLRRRLADPDCPADFAILQDLRAEGCTDYAAFPLLFTDGTIHVATWSTKAPGGFTAKQFADIESVIAPLARVAEIRALRRTAGNLIDTYVGHQTGERILSGKSAAAMSRPSAPRSGCRTCAALLRSRSNCRRRL